MHSYIYIMTNAYNVVLYIGVTSNLETRVRQHKSESNKNSFAYRHNCNKLVHNEVFDDIKYAIMREKQLKDWKRAWKDELISKENPNWNDLALVWDCRASLQLCY